MQSCLRYVAVYIPKIIILENVVGLEHVADQSGARNIDIVYARFHALGCSCFPCSPHPICCRRVGRVCCWLLIVVLDPERSLKLTRKTAAKMREAGVRQIMAHVEIDPEGFWSE